MWIWSSGSSISKKWATLSLDCFNSYSSNLTKYKLNSPLLSSTHSFVHDNHYLHYHQPKELMIVVVYLFQTATKTWFLYLVHMSFLQPSKQFASLVHVKSWIGSRLPFKIIASPAKSLGWSYILFLIYSAGLSRLKHPLSARNYWSLPRLSIMALDFVMDKGLILLIQPQILYVLPTFFPYHYHVSTKEMKFTSHWVTYN